MLNCYVDNAFYFSLKFLILDVDLHHNYKTLNKHIYKYNMKSWQKV